MANFIDHLIEDHEKIKSLLTTYKEDPIDKWEELHQLLSHHTSEEEAVLYPNARKFLKEETDHAVEEHNEADEIMARLEYNKQDEEAFEELRKGLLHHIEEEEKEYFPRCREEFDPLELAAMHEAAKALDFMP